MTMFRSAMCGLTALLFTIWAATSAIADGGNTRGANLSLTSTLNSSIPIQLMDAQTVVGLSVQGLTASGATLTIEGSTDGKNQGDSTKTWVAVNGYALPGGSTTGFTTLSSDQSFRVDVSGYTDLRLRVSSAGTTPITVGYNAIPGASPGFGSASVSVSAPSNVTPTDCSGTITSGGTAQNAIAASSTIHGFVIGNIDASAGSGEPVWFSFTGTASAGSTASYPLSAPTATSFTGFTSFTTPYGLGINHAVSVIATTTGHKFSCTYW